MYLGDWVEDSTHDFKFTTVNTSGVPTTLAGTPAISVYKANGTTESTAGVTLTVDFDSRTGLNHVRLDTSADAFYATANDYGVVITTGTVSGSSVVGYTVASFSIENRFMRGTDSANTTTPPTVVAIRQEMDSNSTQLAAIVTDTGTTLDGKLNTIDSNVDAILVDTNELQTDWVNGGRLDLILDARAAQATADAIETDTQDIQSRLPSALVSGRMSSDAVAISGSTEAADNLEASAETIVIGTAQTGTLSTTQMTTDLSEATDDHYNGRIIIWTSGALQDQATDITDYSGTNGLLTFTAVTESPSNGDTFNIV